VPETAPSASHLGRARAGAAAGACARLREHARRHVFVFSAGRRGGMRTGEEARGTLAASSAASGCGSPRL
jgi:hypothetical protein